MEQLYTLSIGRRARSRLFRTENVYLSVDFHQDWSRISPQDVPRQLFLTFRRMIREIAERLECSPTDYLRMAVHHPGLKTPAFVPFQQYKDVSALQLLNKISNILQSNEEFRMDERMTLEVCHVNPPDGAGSGKTKKRNVGDFEEYLKRKNCLVTIKNNDNLCFQRAIVVAKHYDNKEKTPAWEAERTKLVKHTGPNSFQTKKTRRLIEQVGGSMEACRGHEDWELYGKALAKEGYQLNIYSRQLFGKAAYRSHKYVEGTPKHLNLYHHGHHYDVIAKMAGFVERSYFCETCQVGYNNTHDHKCHVLCQQCQQSGPPCTGNLHKVCPDCHRLFTNQTCYDRHKTRRTLESVPVCNRWKQCVKCGKEWDTIKTHRTLDEHVCGEYKCNICQIYHTKADRWCYIQKVKCPIDIRGNKEDQITALQRKDLTRFVFFDFECQQDSGEHKPNLCVLQLCCHFCILNNDPCRYCDSYWNHQKEVVMQGPDTLDLVGKWFIRLAGQKMVDGGTPNDNVKKASQVICVAHNFKGYDGILMMQTIHKHAVAAPEIIMTGGKVMSIKMGCLKFVDSLNFLPMPLKNMPSTFGLLELKKGYFPHFFNTPENAHYVGPYPPQEAYDPDGMSIKDREKFLKWYDERQHDTFDFNQEILTYCQSDVDILRKSCGEFRRIFLNDTGIDPLGTSMTLAAACNKVYRTHYLPMDSIPIIPRALMQDHGKDWRRYQPRQQSNKALRWLEWEQHTRTMAAFRNGTPTPNIKHATNGGEVKVGPYSLDGFDRENNVAYEFFGCAFHGCPTCYPGPGQDVRHFHPHDPSRTMRELYAQTQRRLHDLRTKYDVQNIVTVWECQVEKQRRDNDDMEEFFNALETNGWPYPEPLFPRDAFFGGRTNAIQLIARPKENEEIRYLDVVSLYPYICKYGKFPIQEPEIITRPELDRWRDYEGLIQCKVVPPRGLYHPVLPFKWNNKTTFPLCRSCIMQHMQGSEIAEYVPCSHSDEDRAWIGTYVSLELKKAASVGYVIKDVYEVWHWSEDKWSQYDAQTKTGGLFTGYIDHYLKTKMESSGYPSECRTDQEKEQFLAQVNEKEGIELDPTKMVYNNGIRSCSKLKLNILWGKFGQRDNFSQTEYITEPSRYFELMMDVTENIKDVQLVNDNMVMVERLKLEDHVQPSPITNVVIAAFVTAQARLKLYSVLQPLGERVCYFDTDSVIYKHDPKKWNPPRGNSLGEWKDELEDSVTITEFVSGGAKNYAYKMSNGQTVCKVRGFTLNYRGSQNLNFDSVKGMVENVHQNTSLTSTNPFKITRTRDRRLCTRQEDKQYKVVYTKRFVQFNDKDEFINTFPYGY